MKQNVIWCYLTYRPKPQKTLCASYYSHEQHAVIQMSPDCGGTTVISSLKEITSFARSKNTTWWLDAHKSYLMRGNWNIIWWITGNTSPLLQDTLKWSMVTKSGKKGKMSSIFNKSHSCRNSMARRMSFWSCTTWRAETTHSGLKESPTVKKIPSLPTPNCGTKGQKWVGWGGGGWRERAITKSLFFFLKPSSLAPQKQVFIIFLNFILCWKWWGVQKKKGPPVLGWSLHKAGTGGGGNLSFSLHPPPPNTHSHTLSS